MSMEKLLKSYGAERVPPLRSGWTPIKCPFHDDSQASASVCLTGFNCHACGIKGDLISLVQVVDQCGYKDAVSKLKSLDAYTQPAEEVWRPPGRRGRR